MRCRLRGTAATVALVLALSGSFSCRSKPRPAPPRSAVPVEEIRRLVTQGDAELLEAHLHGWRRAESFYEKASSLARDPALDEKLRLTRFLILTRQFDEDIPDPRSAQRLASVCSPEAEPRARFLCELATRRAAAPGAPADLSVPNGGDSALDAYLLALARASFRLEPPAGLAERFKDSPLFLYLGFGAHTMRRSAELEKQFPRFAELFLFLGEVQFQQARYRSARSYFTRALELVPEYTRAHNGLANIHFFALEDYDKALEMYEQTISWDGGNATALFGKGAALHHLGRFTDSDFALDRMLESIRTRRTRMGAATYRYLESGAYYYKAQNHYAIGDRVRARELVDEAKRAMPESVQAGYLSGLLFYEDKELEKARDELEAVARRANENCHARYYLGMIGSLLQDGKAPEHFIRTCACIEGTVRGLERQIRSLPSLDVEEAERQSLKVKLDAKLLDYRRSSIGLVRDMVRVSEQGEKGAGPSDLQVMNNLLTRLGTLP
jgi:tetratricopeptide (TPR) repeat protein